MQRFKLLAFDRGGLFPSNILVADIGTRTLKLLLLSKQEGKVRIIHAAEIDLRGMKEPGSAGWLLTVVEKIHHFIKESKAKTDSLRLTLSLPGTVLRSYSLPKMPPTELEKALEWQLREQMEANLDDYYWDYMSSSPKTAPDHTYNIVAAIPRKLIDDLLRYLEQKNIWLDTIDITPRTAWTFLKERFPEKNAVIVSLGANRTELSLAIEGDVLLSRHVEIGGSSITTRLISSLTTDGPPLNFEQAEAIKQKVGLTPVAGEALGPKGPQARALMQQSFDGILHEIRRFLLYCQEQVEISALHMLILHGGEARIPGIGAYFQQQMGGELEVAVVDSLDPVSVSAPAPHQQFISANSATFVNALGISLMEKGMRLISPTAKTKRFVLARRVLYATSAVVLASLGVWYGFLLTEYSSLKKNTVSIQQNIAELQVLERRFTDLYAQVQRITQRKALMTSLTDPEARALQYLPAFALYLPDDLLFTSVQYGRQANEFRIEGIAVKIDRSVELIISSYVTLLEGSGLFEWVSVLSQMNISEFEREMAKIVIAAKGK